MSLANCALCSAITQVWMISGDPGVSKTRFGGAFDCFVNVRFGSKADAQLGPTTKAHEFANLDAPDRRDALRFPALQLSRLSPVLAPSLLPRTPDPVDDPQAVEEREDVSQQSDRG